MKKFFALVSFVALILSANVGSCGYLDGNAQYPKYLDGDKVYVLCGVHAGTAWYVNRKNIDVVKSDTSQVQLAVEVAVVPRAGDGDLTAKYVRNEYLYDLAEHKIYAVRDGEKVYIAPYGSTAELPSSYDGELAFSSCTARNSTANFMPTKISTSTKIFTAMLRTPNISKFAHVTKV